MPNRSIKRRTFGGLLLSSCVMAYGAADKRDTMEPFHWARVKFLTTDKVKDEWNAHPNADVYMLKELKTRTGLNIDTTWYVAPLENLDEMCKYPFLFMTSEGRFEFTPQQQRNMVEYLKRGGFVFADDCIFSEGRVDGFFLDFREKIEALFGRPMTKLRNNHEIYHSFYDLPDGVPYINGINHGGYALFIDGRMAIFLTSTDIHCGWKSLELNSHGEAGYFPQSRCEEAVKMGVNIMMYVMSH